MAKQQQRSGPDLLRKYLNILETPVSDRVRLEYQGVLADGFEKYAVLLDNQVVDHILVVCKEMPFAPKWRVIAPNSKKPIGASSEGEALKIVADYLRREGILTEKAAKVHLTAQDKKEGYYINDRGEKVNKEGFYADDQDGDGIPDFLKPNNAKTFELYKSVFDDEAIDKPRKEKQAGDRCKVFFDKGDKKGETYYFSTVTAAFRYGRQFRKKTKISHVISEPGSGTEPQYIKLYGTNKGVNLRDIGEFENELEAEYNGRFEAFQRMRSRMLTEDWDPTIQGYVKLGDGCFADTGMVVALKSDPKKVAGEIQALFRDDCLPGAWQMLTLADGTDGNPEDYVRHASNKIPALKPKPGSIEPDGGLKENVEGANFADNTPVEMLAYVADKATPEIEKGVVCQVSTDTAGNVRIYVSPDGMVRDGKADGPYKPTDLVRFQDPIDAKYKQEFGENQMENKHGFNATELKNYIAERIMRDEEGNLKDPEWSDYGDDIATRRGHVDWQMFSRESDVLLADAFKQVLEMQYDSPAEALFAFHAKVRDLSEIGLAEITDTAVRDKCLEEICNAYRVHNKIGVVSEIVSEFNRGWPDFRMYSFAGETELRRIWKMAIDEEEPWAGHGSAEEYAVAECEEAAKKYPEAKDEVVINNMKKLIREKDKWIKDDEGRQSPLPDELDEGFAPTGNRILDMIAASLPR